MGVLRRHHTAIATFALLFFSNTLFLHKSLGGNLLVGAFEVKPEREEAKRALEGEKILDPVVTRRRLGGPGSSPPTCRSKCGKCWPCKPVHVPIQPGRSVPLEYYPEAWRCKCGDKLFMP